MLRLSTNLIFRTGIDAIVRGQSELTATQTQLGTGKRINQPSDDPTGAVQALDLTRSIRTVQQYQRNSGVTEQRLSLQEDLVASVGEELQRIRELTVAASTDTQTSETRALIALEVEARLDSLVSLANSRDANGEYVFSGFQTDTVPFSSDGTGGYTYNGDNGQRRIQISEVRQVADRDPGDAVFMRLEAGNGTFVTAADAGNTGSGSIGFGSVTDISSWVPDNYAINFTSATDYEVVDSATPTPNVIATGTYTSGSPIAFNGIQVAITGAPASGDSYTVGPSGPRDLFAIVESLRAALSNGAADPTARALQRSQVDRAFGELDGAIAHFSEIRASIGARLNAIEDQRNLQEAALLTLQDGLSSVEDLDYAEAISRFNQQTVTLEAAQQTYTRVQGLSLFNFL